MGTIKTLKQRQARLAYLLVSPAIFLMLVIFVLPIITVLVISFTDYSLLNESHNFIGFENYTNMFSDEVFGNALWNTIIYAAIVLPLSFLPSLMIAIAIQERKHFRSVLEVLYFLPVTSTLTAMALVWAAMMDSKQGVINNLIQMLNGSPLNFLGSENLVLFSLAIISLWAIIGFNMVLFLAGLTAIPKQLYESAEIDGADHPIDKFFKVTWPMLGPTVMFVVVTTFITAFKLFDTVAILTQGGPGRASEVFLYLAYLEGFENFNMGYSAALALVFLGIIFVFAFLQTKLGDKNIHY